MSSVNFQWRTLEERAAGEPASGPESFEPRPRRREFLQIASAAAAVVGLGGCFRQPAEQMLPYARTPPEQTPGIATHHATGLTLGGLTIGLVVTSREGRPMKVEGNPLHPASRGATGPIEQASLLDLYDPKRARVVRFKGSPTALASLEQALAAEAKRGDEGEGLRFLVEPSASPLEQDLQRKVLARFPRARFVGFAPAESEEPSRGARLAFGREVDVVHHAERARVVVSLDADFLSVTPRTMALAQDFVDARRPDRLSRLYVAESSLTLTGAFADHRLRRSSRQVHSLGRALAAYVLRKNEDASLGADDRRWVKRVGDELLAHHGEGLVLVGDAMPAELHALGFALNEALGNLGSTLTLIEPLLQPRARREEFAELVSELDQGKVSTLVITAWNPVLAAPVDSGFAAALSKARSSFYLGLHEDETSAKCTWFAPSTHSFERWGDGRAVDGTASILQPLIQPIFPGLVDPLSLLTSLLSETRSAHSLLRESWASAQWERSLADGVIPGTQSPALDVHVAANDFAERRASSGLELRFSVDRRSYDGRFALNAWLQELPDPITQLSWDGAALISPTTATRLGLTTSQRVRLTYRKRVHELPVLVLPGQADDTVGLLLADSRSLRCADAPWFDGGVTLEPLDEKTPLTLAQLHSRMEGRELALERSAKEFDSSQLVHLRTPEPSFFPGVESPGFKWGMTIDLHRCIGCSACVIACQAENNIPAVGRDEVRRGRELHWLRVDRYFTGSESDPQTITQPVACVHCEAAPCEYVCPVNATVHSDEGLNQMVYNRCIGTRYCSNNCPYKVRRFNYLAYTDATPLEQLARNPDVTVRGRGVMEKCTYCVQRIERARHTTRKGQPLDVQTACQQACPTRAIVFGDLNEVKSAVAEHHRDGRAYALLHELGTTPRTRHLLRLKNPDPELA